MSFCHFGPFMIGGRTPGMVPNGGGGPIMAMGLRMGGGRMPVIMGFIIGGMYGIPGIPGLGGAPKFGGGMETPAGFGGPAAAGPPANGLFVILPALKAAVVASIKCWACSSIHFW